MIPLEKLNAESVFYWAWICSVCKGKRASFEVDAEKAEECLDSLLPSLTEFREYTNQVINHIEHIESEEDERLHLENLFIIERLIKMFEYLDFSDVHGKKTLIHFCHALFSNKKYVTCFDTIMSLYKLLVPSLEQRINKAIELIAHVKRAGDEGEVVNETVGGEVIEVGEASEHSEAVCEPANVDANRLFELRIKDVGEEAAPMEGSGQKGDIEKKNESIYGNILELVDREDAQPVQDPTECIIHCLNIAYCLLKDVGIVRITPQLESLFESLVIPNIGSASEDIRIMVLKVMGLILILKLEIAQKYVPLLLEMIQHKRKDVVIAGNFQKFITFGTINSKEPYRIWDLFTPSSTRRLFSKKNEIKTPNCRKLISTA